MTRHRWFDLKQCLTGICIFYNENKLWFKTKLSEKLRWIYTESWAFIISWQFAGGMSKGEYAYYVRKLARQFICSVCGRKRRTLLNCYCRCFRFSTCDDLPISCIGPKIFSNCDFSHNCIKSNARFVCFRKNADRQCNYTYFVFVIVFS